MSVILLHIRITQTVREKRKESVSLKPYYVNKGDYSTDASSKMSHMPAQWEYRSLMDYSICRQLISSLLCRTVSYCTLNKALVPEWPCIIEVSNIYSSYNSLFLETQK